MYTLRNSGIREEDAGRGREEGSECRKNKEIVEMDIRNGKKEGWIVKGKVRGRGVKKKERDRD